MTPFEWIALASLVISLISQTGSEIGNTRAKNINNEWTSRLNKLMARVQEKNAIDNQAITTLNNAINSLYGIRSQIDPRMIQKIDKAIDDNSRKVAEKVKNIESRNATYSEAVSKQQTEPGSFSSLFSSGNTDAISPFEKRINES